jgi:hypothetical protein
MNQPENRRRTLLWAVVSVLVAPVLLFAASLLGLFPWSPINCTHHDVDIQSGRLRLTRYIFWLRVHESFEDSALTKALRPEDYAATKPEWRHAVTLSPGLRHSPHYIYHSAIAQIRQLELAWSLAEFTPAARRASAKRILQLWQQTGGDDGAKPYLRALDNFALADNAGERTIDERDLPRE